MIELTEAAALFDMRGDLVHGHPYGSGHLNDTICAYYDQAGQRVRYIHQRIAGNVFPDPIRLMDNISRVTSHALNKLQDEGNKECYRRTLTCIPAVDGKPYTVDSEGSVWRTYPFIERARSYDQITSTEQCIEAAKAFGEFQNLGADLGGEPLFETIPNFHNTKVRFENLVAAIEKDEFNRAKDVQKEIDWFMNLQSQGSKVVDMLASGEIPLRVTHNDTKLNNVMLDDVTGEGVCVIDLDTTMSGSAVYDFGDMVRTATSPAAEDEIDVTKVDMRIEMFEALVKGYLSSANNFLTTQERELLPFAGKLLTMECGTRFLTDYLSGDVYFKTYKEGHNMDRARTQIALVEAIDKKMGAMEDVVKKYS